jgi:predicted anti-sigma-YlaC factor YlaD
MTMNDATVPHPNLERYYDRATDRLAVDAHLAGCAACRAWLTKIHERLAHLACMEFVELVTDYLDDSLDHALSARIKDHLRLCEGCRNYLDVMQSTVATIGRIRRTSEPSPRVRVALIATFRAWRDVAPEVPGDDHRTSSRHHGV